MSDNKLAPMIIGGALVVAGVAAAIATELPDIRRYMKIRSM